MQAKSRAEAAEQAEAAARTAEAEAAALAAQAEDEAEAARRELEIEAATVDNVRRSPGDPSVAEACVATAEAQRGACAAVVGRWRRRQSSASHG
jgi:hypothetical protein